MAFEHYIRTGGRNLRLGYTTGTCAALAAQGAVRGLLFGKIPSSLRLVTPAGIEVFAKPVGCGVEYREGAAHLARCGVVKDAGDDRDATDGLVIMAQAGFCDPAQGFFGTGVSGEGSCGEDRCREDRCGEGSCGEDRFGNDSSGEGPAFVRILGGEGIGRVTKPGLEMPVGEAAINRVPREMIRREVLRVCREKGYAGGVTVTVYAPEGEKAASKTLNEKMGIVGGISIIGTSGIVEPMSMKAYADSVRLMIRQAAASGRAQADPPDMPAPAMDTAARKDPSFSADGTHRGLILTPGNYGLAFLRQQGYDRMQLPVVVCSNFIGEALDEAAADGFDRILLIGHLGKLVKTAAGIMNTHSSMADGRAEIFTAHAAVCGAPAHICRRLMEAVSSDACIAILKEEGIEKEVLGSILDKAQEYLGRRCADARCGIIVFSNTYGALMRSAQAEAILREMGYGHGPAEKQI